MQNKISVILITGNEEQNIRDCLESVNWADELIVVDSESTDRTVKIAKTYTEKVFINPWKGYSNQKKYALSKTTHEWILSIDADERVSTELKDFIRKEDINTADGYYIIRENYFLGKKITGCGWGDDYQLRLVKKSKAKITDSLVHEGFVVKGKSMKIDHPIVHYTNESLHQALAKANEYSSLFAKEKYKVRKVGFTSLAIKPFIALSQHFIARKGFKDGIYGFLVSLIHSITKLQELAKIWELKRNARAK